MFINPCALTPINTKFIVRLQWKVQSLASTDSFSFHLKHFLLSAFTLTGSLHKSPESTSIFLLPQSFSVEEQQRDQKTEKSWTVIRKEMHVVIFFYFRHLKLNMDYTCMQSVDRANQFTKCTSRLSYTFCEDIWSECKFKRIRA